MELDYTKIFACVVDLIKGAMPVSIFLYFLDIMVDLFFRLAFPRIRRND